MKNQAQELSYFSRGHGIGYGKVKFIWNIAMFHEIWSWSNNAMIENQFAGVHYSLAHGLHCPFFVQGNKSLKLVLN